MVFLFPILRYINKMATDGGGGAVDGRQSATISSAILVPGKMPTPVSFVFYVKIDVYEFVYVAKFFHHRSFVFF